MSETSRFGLTAQGGHTAFLDCVDLMRSHPDLEIHVNSRNPCDLLHSHSWGPFYITKGLAYRSRRILTVHALPETAEGALPLMGPATRPLVRTYMRAIYNFADLVIAVAPASVESLRALGVRSRIEVVPNALRNERFFPSSQLRRQGRALLGIPDERPVVIGVGQLQPRKGISDFVETALRLPDKQFIWIGGRPFGLASAGIFEMRRLRAHPPPNVTFAGPFDLSHMPSVYNAADCLLFPSFQENCPYAPMEAASCGVPVIFRDLPEYKLLYSSDYIASSTVQGFTNLIRQVLGLSSHRELLRLASLRLAAGFRPAAFIESVAQLYDQLACETVAAR